MSYMDGPPLATAADLQAFLQREVQAATAETTLRLASGLVRSYTGQRITLTTSATYVLAGGGTAVRLPQRPVVVDDGHPLTVVELAEYGAANLAATENLTYTRFQDELSRRHGTWSPRVQVTYSHGYASVPDDIVGVVLDLAGRALTNPDGLRSLSLGDYSVTYASETVGSGALNAANKAVLAAYRRTAATVRL